MEILTVHVPAMYGDHHVLEVRRILFEMPGIEQVHASSCFRVVEIAYDPTRLNPDAIRSALDAQGYLRELPAPAELATTTHETNRSFRFLRHTTAHEGTQKVISFAQNVMDSGQPLWPCPGFGTIRRMNDDGEETHP